MADGLILHYTKEKYQNKVNLMKEYHGSLGQHLDKLRGLRGQVETFWDDPQTPDYMKALDDEIRAVENAMHRAEREFITLQSIIDDSTDLVSETTSVIGDIVGTITGLGIK